MSKFKLIIGLGNIGRQYEDTRHNVGFMLLDEFARQEQLNWQSSRFKAQTIRHTFAEERVILAKPTTLMNLSGQAVLPLVNFYKVDLKDLLVVYDDFDTQLGTLRIRAQGGAGSHNGMKSVIANLGSQKFPRFRIGIGPKPPQMETVSFVLGKFSESEREKLEPCLSAGVEALRLYIKSGIDLTMNRYNKAQESQ